MDEECVAFVSHCLLNSYSKVQKHDKKHIEGERAVRSGILTLLLNNDVGIIQLPCPEMTCYGLKRWGHVKNQFEHPHFINQCKALLAPCVSELIEYRNNGYKLFGVIGIERSPSCGIAKTYRGEWRGEISGNPIFTDNKPNSIYLADEKGLFMEILEHMLIDAGFEDTKFYGYSPQESVELYEQLSCVIEGGRTDG